MGPILDDIAVTSSEIRVWCWRATSVNFSSVMEWVGIAHEQLCMWMVLPNQTGGLQALHHVSGDELAVEKPGIGSGWKQSKQNWLPPAVMGFWT